MSLPRSLLARTLVLAGLALPALAGDRAAFEKELERAHEEIADSDWEDAQQRLKTLLESHARERYAIEAFPAIREDLRRCAFWLEHDEPDFESLVSGTNRGKLRPGGNLKIRYESGQLGDFTEHGIAHFYPVTFRGPYTIEFEFGGRWGGAFPAIITGLETECELSVVAGRRGGVALFENGKFDWIESFPSYESLKIVRGEDKMDVWADGKKVYKHRQRGMGLGRIVLQNFGVEAREFQLQISGKMQTSWLQGLLDDAVQETFDEFKEAYDEDQLLPAWVLEEGADFEAANKSSYPGPYLEKQGELWVKGNELLEGDSLTKFKTFVRTLKGRKCTTTFCTYWEMCLDLWLGDYDDALKKSEAVLQDAPEHVQTQLMQILIRRHLGAHDEALTSIGDLFSQNPLNTEVARSLAWSLLNEGKIDAARGVVLESFEAGAPLTSLSDVLSMIGKADRGPDWGESYEVTSRHYHVRSNIDVQLCKEASRVLESALRAYKKDLGREPREDRVYRVMLFSGRTGYMTYTDELLGIRRENTAGLYSPGLKQLLIWNLPDRAEMFRTVQHEGFHQYLDSIMDDAPRWLNEGLAEYYEIMELDGLVTQADRGQPNRTHLWLLDEEGTLPLEEFLYMSPAEFYEGQTSYSQAWSFVNFLLHSTDENRAIFDGLIDLLCDGLPVQEALHTVFDDLDLKELQRAYRAHVRSL